MCCWRRCQVLGKPYDKYVTRAICRATIAVAVFLDRFQPWGRCSRSRAPAYEDSMSVSSVMPADKGLFNGACNRSACLARPATWWNKSTRAHYCAPCAKTINEYNAEDAKRLYNAPLCEPSR